MVNVQLSASQYDPPFDVTCFNGITVNSVSPPIDVHVHVHAFKFNTLCVLVWNKSMKIHVNIGAVWVLVQFTLNVACDVFHVDLILPNSG